MILNHLDPRHNRRVARSCGEFERFAEAADTPTVSTTLAAAADATSVFEILLMTLSPPPFLYMQTFAHFVVIATLSRIIAWMPTA